MCVCLTHIFCGITWLWREQTKPYEYEEFSTDQETLSHSATPVDELFYIYHHKVENLHTNTTQSGGLSITWLSLMIKIALWCNFYVYLANEHAFVPQLFMQNKSGWLIVWRLKWYDHEEFFTSSLFSMGHCMHFAEIEGKMQTIIIWAVSTCKAPSNSPRLNHVHDNRNNIENMHKGSSPPLI